MGLEVLDFTGVVVVVKVGEIGEAVLNSTEQVVREGIVNTCTRRPTPVYVAGTRTGVDLTFQVGKRKSGGCVKESAIPGESGPAADGSVPIHVGAEIDARRRARVVQVGPFDVAL